MKWAVLYRSVALLLALNYFAFQVELFEEEYEANHRRTAETCSLDTPSLTWESFDKENAPKAFVFDAGIRLEYLFLLKSDPPAIFLSYAPFQPIRDKSPPAAMQESL